VGVELALALLLLAGNGFFVAVEFSIARLRPTQVTDFEREGRPGAKSARHAVERIDAYLAACQLGITICSLGLGALGKPAFEELLEPLLGEDARIGGVALSVLVGFTLITVLHIVVGELSPKSLAIARTGPTALVLAPPMRLFYLVTKPLVDLFNWMGNVLLKPFGIPPASEAGHAPHSEDELRALLREAVEGGEIEAEEGQLGENVLLFGDRRAREVMRPRPEVDFVRTTESVSDAAARAIETGRTRLPLCEPEGGLDAAVGVVNAKDLLEPVIGGRQVRLEDLARPLVRVSESTLIDELLRDLRRKRQHVALVVDEHGTTVGLVTMEDILEEIVGEIEDEFDPREADLVRETPDGLVVDGATPVRLVAERLDADLEDHHEATIGGLVVERLGRLPAAGEHVDLAGHAAEVIRVGDAVIEELRFPGAAGEPVR
jgi:CBS domain containing-hemolysin-like protein